MTTQVSYIVRHRGNSRNAWSIQEELEGARASKAEALVKWPQYDLVIVKRETIETIIE